jgi:hypothetical protein
MKRVITIKGDDGDIQIEVTAKIITSGSTKRETEQVTNRIARNLFNAVTEQTIPYASFGVHNTTVRV